MTTRFESTQIKGKGRGKFLGYPTINLKPPENFDLPDGVYAVWATLGGTRVRGAMHWGAIPTFDESDKSLEVFLMGMDGEDFGLIDSSRMTVEVVGKLREVLKFDSIEELTEQMGKDVQEARRILTE